jgi:hypothetical protein
VCLFTMSKRASPDSIIDLTLDSEDDQASRRIGDLRENLPSFRVGGKKIKTEESSAAASGVRSAVQYDDVEVVDGSAAAMMVAAVAQVSESAAKDDDVVMVGTVNEVSLPHMRPHCTKFKFQSNATNRTDVATQNMDHCDLCYCYACDCPVKNCKVSLVHDMSEL